MKATDVNGDPWTLVDQQTGSPLEKDQAVTTFRGETATLNGGRPPLCEASTGRVWIGSGWAEFYPGVIGAKWVRDT